MSVNKVTILGNVGDAPIIRQTNDGKEIASFSIATSENWKDKATGEKKSITDWHQVVVFSQGLVGIIKSYVKKGSKLYLEGQLKTRKWTDKHGIDKYSTEIILQNFNSILQLLDSKGSSSNEEPKAKVENKEPDLSEDYDQDIPF